MSHIKLDNVSFKYKHIYHDRKSLKRYIFGKKNLLINESLQNKNQIAKLSLNIFNGERVAVLGKNGSGKTTLLRIISKIFCHDSGVISVKGRMQTLIDAQIGISDDLTGLDIIRLKLLMQDNKKHKIKELVPKIIQFADLGDAINQPIRTYSTGMKLRLDFSITFSEDQDILILDEWLSVGDEGFRGKANQRLREAKDKSDILLLATHDLNLAKHHCDRGIILSDGKIVLDGGIQEVIKAYELYI